jgi:UDP-N-acetylmuramate--alanine ligase
MLPSPGSRIHFLGIGGIGVSAVARIALAHGYVVSGSDVRRSQLTDGIAAAGATVHIGHLPEHVDGVDLVVISTAIPDHNVELRRAREIGCPLMHRSELLAAFVRRYTSIGVTGTHGKGTTAAMLTSILDADGRQPGFVIGGLLQQFRTNARPGAGQFMVVEVDESDGTHANILTDLLICNYLEADHLNYYRDLEHIIESMAEVVNTNASLQNLFVNIECDGNRRLRSLVERPVITYGLTDDAEFTARILGAAQMPIRFEVVVRGESWGEFELPVAGRYNVTNALGAIAVAQSLGCSRAAMREGLATYGGLENRFTIADADGITIVKDYNSHPTAIRKVLQSARDLADGRIFSVFKPYRYTLTSYLQDEYATAFDGSDTVVITTMYAANEDPIEGIDTDFVVRKLRENGLNVQHIPDQNGIVPWLAANARPGDLVLFFGGDDFFAMADAWTNERNGRRP